MHPGGGSDGRAGSERLLVITRHASMIIAVGSRPAPARNTQPAEVGDP